MIQRAIRAALVCCIILSTVSSSMFAQDDFETAAKALEGGDFSTALPQLEAIEATGQVSSELYANLGKAHYLNGSIGQAILAYERALKLDPGNREVSKSVDNIRQELDVRLTDVPDFVLISAQRGFVQSFSPTMWVTLQIVTGVLALGCLYLLWFKPDVNIPKKWVRIIMVVCAVLFLLTFLFSHQAAQYRNSQNLAIVMVEMSSISQAPDDLSPEIGEVSEGVKVWITDELGDWFKVVLRDKDEGWIKKSEVEII